MVTSNYVIYHKSYGSYCNDEKTSIKRMSMYWFFYIFNLIHFVEFTISIVWPDQFTKSKVGYPFIVITNQYKLFYALAFLTSLAVFLGKIFIFSFESNKKAHIFTLLHSWQTDHHHLFGLNHVNTNKLIIQGQLIYWTTRFAIIYYVV